MFRLRPYAVTAAAAAVLVFPVLVVVQQFIQRGHYSPVRQAISELALGQDGWLQAIAFCSLAVGTLALAAVIRQITGGRVAPALLTLSGFFTFLSAIFRADPSSSSTTTLHGAVHQTIGLLTFICIVVSMFVSARAMRRDVQWRQYGGVTRIWALCCLPAFALVPVLGQNDFGIAQRVLIGLLVAWIATTLLYVRHQWAPRRRAQSSQKRERPAASNALRSAASSSAVNGP